MFYDLLHPFLRPKFAFGPHFTNPAAILLGCRRSTILTTFLSFGYSCCLFVKDHLFSVRLIEDLFSLNRKLTWTSDVQEDLLLIHRGGIHSHTPFEWELVLKLFNFLLIDKVPSSCVH